MSQNLGPAHSSQMQSFTSGKGGKSSSQTKNQGNMSLIQQQQAQGPSTQAGPPSGQKINKNVNRRTQLFSMGGGTAPGLDTIQAEQMQKQMAWHQQKINDLDLSDFMKQGPQLKGHLRNATMTITQGSAMAVKASGGGASTLVQKQQVQQKKPQQKQNSQIQNFEARRGSKFNMVQATEQADKLQNLDPNSSMNFNNAAHHHKNNTTVQQYIATMGLGSPQNAAFTQKMTAGSSNQDKRLQTQTINATVPAKQAQRRNQQQQNLSQHHRGRSSGLVQQKAINNQIQLIQTQASGLMNNTSGGLSELHQMIQAQQQQMQAAQGVAQFNQGYNTNINPITSSSNMGQQVTANVNQAGNSNSSNNPFRRQKQQTKYQQKYQQQLQMYQSSNRIQSKNSNQIQQQFFQDQKSQQQQILNYNDNVNKIPYFTSAASLMKYRQAQATQNLINQNINSCNMQSIQNQLQKTGQRNEINQSDHRKAPSSINLQNQTSFPNNLNTINLLSGYNGQNIANMSNMGTIAMTHQQLPIQPQISQNLILQQIREDKITEQQILESEEYFEQGKQFLAEKKYQEASKMFTKSLIANKTNYDALFYRAVTNLDQDMPEKAILDLEELMKICTDYRKTMFIVLSIAYRRVNDYLSAIRVLSKAIQKYPQYLEAYIARGQIYIFQKKWDKALNDFCTVVKSSVTNGMGHLGQGDSLKGLGKIEEAIQSYTKVIEVDPSQISQGLMKRGLLYLQLKKNEEALEDFSKLSTLAEEAPQDYLSTSLNKAYFYKAKALKKLNNFNDSVLYFEQVLRLADDNFLSGSALYEIAKIKIQCKDFYEAHYNLQRSAHLNLKQKKLQNYKLFTEGVIFLMKRKTKTGVKLLTQVINRMKAKTNLAQGKSSNDNNKALEKNKDETEESPVFNESQNSSRQSPVPDDKNQMAVGSAVTLSAGDEKDYIYPLLYIYRAYGYIILEDYDNSFKDFSKSSSIKKLNNSQQYNMILCQGLKNLQHKEYENAIFFFTKSAQKQPKKRDPYLLRAMSIVEFTVNKPVKPQTKMQMIKDAKKDLNQALENSPKDESVLFLRGILNFSLHRFYDAIADFERVIEKTDETNALHYLARGRCYACLSMFKEAITDLSIAINLNKDMLDAYLNRGKCAYLIGDTGLAFMDFQKLIVLEPKNPTVHIYAGNLLMTTGSYEDATKAFTNADNIQKSPLALYQRSRCHVALNNMQDALDDLNKVIEISHTDKVAIQDRECLNALKICSLSAEKTPSSNDKATFLKSAQAITKLISYEKNENVVKMTHESSILHQHSQIIPSAHRTKMDKIRAIRRRKEQDRVQRENPEAGRKNDLRFRVQQNNEEGSEEINEYEDISELDDKEIHKLNRKLARNESDELDQGSSQDDEEGEQDANYYKENIFNKEDFYLYRAVLYTYGQEYEKAIQDLEQCSAIMHQNKVLFPKNQFPDKDLEAGYDSPTGVGNVNGRSDINEENQSQGSSQTDLSDVGLCSLNVHEYSFNIALALILAKDYTQALTKLDYILDTIAKKYANQLWLLRGIINEILGYSKQSKQDFKRAYKYDKENAQKFLERKEDIELSVFPQQQRLCSFFQHIKADFKEFKGSFASIYLKPSFSFPFIKPPNMIPCVDQNVVLEQFKFKKANVQLKPEAPWIKKCQFGIKFTEEILYTDDDREPTPDEEKEYKKRKQRQQERAMEGAGFIRAHSEKVELKFNIFAEDINEGDKPSGQGAAEEQDEDDDGENIYVDEDGNPINLAELAELGENADLGMLGDLAEFGDLDNLQGIEQTLAEQMKILKEMQKQQQSMHKDQQQQQSHRRTKTHGVPDKKRNEMQIQDELNLNETNEDMDVALDHLQSSPENDFNSSMFNKVQNLTKMKALAKQINYR